MQPFKTLAVLFFTFFLIISPARAEEDTGPALWSISDEDTTIYIFGTIHLMTAGVNWKTPKVMAAFEGADVLILEMGPDQFDPKIAQAMVLKHGKFTNGQNLQRVLTGAGYARVERELLKLGLASNALDSLKPWLVATFITLQVAQQNGFLPQLGVDKTLMDKALAEGKKIQGLETLDYQFGVFSNLPMETQVSYLEDTLKQLGDMNQLFEILRDAWFEGDLETLNGQLNQGWDHYPELRETLFDNRNKNWARVLSKTMKKPGQFFMAVGTGHLVGTNSLIEILEKEGFSPKRQ